MSEHVWVKKITLDTILARLNNIKIKYSSSASKASAKPYGSGTGAGINITLPKSSSGDTYLGHFKVINSSVDSTLQVDVVDGIDVDTEKCGIVTAGLTLIRVAKATVPIGSRTKTWICHKLTYDIGWVSEIVAIDPWVQQVDGTYYTLLAVVEVGSAGAIKSIQQIQYGDINVAGRLV